MRMTWREKYESRQTPIIEFTKKRFADIPAGTTMLISTPAEIERAVRRIPEGREMTMPDLRDHLARLHHVEKACPITTGIFLRIASEVAAEELAEGKTTKEVMPFWRVVRPNSVIGRKLACGPEFILQMRVKEGLTA